MSVNQQPAREASLPLNAIVSYSMPTVGIGFMFFLVTLYLMKFGTDNLMISPVAMGVIFGISRIWDPTSSKRRLASSAAARTAGPTDGSVILPALSALILATSFSSCFLCS